MKLLGPEQEDNHLVKPLVGIIGELSEKYINRFPAEEEEKEEEEGPRTHELAYVVLGDEIKYGFRNIETGEGGFDSLRVCPKTKRLIKLITEYGAQVIQARIGFKNNRDTERLHKIAEKCGYDVQMEGMNYVMVKEGYTISKEAEIPTSEEQEAS